MIVNFWLFNLELGVGDTSYHPVSSFDFGSGPEEVLLGDLEGGLTLEVGFGTV